MHLVYMMNEYLGFLRDCRSLWNSVDYTSYSNSFLLSSPCKFQYESDRSDWFCFKFVCIFTIIVLRLKPKS